MGGNLMIKSNVGKGTDVIITLDQRVYHEKEKSILAHYENSINSSRGAANAIERKDISKNRNLISDANAFDAFDFEKAINY